MNIIDFIQDDNLAGAAGLGDPSWSSWHSLLKAAFALPLDDNDLNRFNTHTGGRKLPTTPVRELWCVVGRRGGKSRIASALAVYLATKDYREFLAPGEVATIMLLATDRKQSRHLKRYIEGILRSSSMLEQLVEQENKETIQLTNRVNIEIHSSSYRSVRGYSVAAAICDELAFWPHEGADSPDEEVIGALKPAMASVPGSMLICISSPYSRRGALWKAWKNYYGKDDDRILVWNGSTEAMNSDVDKNIIQEAFQEDPAAAAAEYGDQNHVYFRKDLESYIQREIVEACVLPNRRRIPFNRNHQYFCFADAASGAGRDSYTAAICHLERRDDEVIAVLDLVVEHRPPFDPTDVTKQIVEAVKPYGITSVIGDHWSGTWPISIWKSSGIDYKPHAKPKSDIYASALPLLTSGRIELLDDERLINQISSLERRAGRGGKGIISEPPNGSDDVANSSLGVLQLAIECSATVSTAALARGWGRYEMPTGEIPRHRQSPTTTAERVAPSFLKRDWSVRR